MSATADTTSAEERLLMAAPADEERAADARNEANTLQQDVLFKLPWRATWILLVSLAAVGASLMVMLSHGQQGYFLPMLAVTWCVLAAIFDASTGRIPNQLTYPAALLGLALNLASPLIEGNHAAQVWLASCGPAQCLVGFGGALMFLLVSPLFGDAVHGGDLKLLTALGATIGLTALSTAAIIAVVAGVIFGICNLIARRRVNAAFRIAAQRALELFYLKKFETPLPDDAGPFLKSHIPLAIPMALGVIAVTFLHVRPFLVGGT